MKSLKSLLNKKRKNEEIEKVKKKFEFDGIFNTSILNKAANLSFFELLGNPGLINREVEAYRKVDHQMISEAIERYFIFRIAVPLIIFQVGKRVM